MGRMRDRRHREMQFRSEEEDSAAASADAHRLRQEVHQTCRSLSQHRGRSDLTFHRELFSMGDHTSRGSAFLFPNVSMMGCQLWYINRLLMLPSFLSHVYGFSIG